MSVTLETQWDLLEIALILQVKEEAEKAAGVCEFDVCNDLETGGNAIKTACDLTEAFNKYLEESKLGATNWRSDFCGKDC